MRKRGILIVAVLTAAALMAGCGSSSGEDTEALANKKAVSEAAGASSVLGNATGDYAGENNLVYAGYLPSEYVTLGDYKGLSVNKIKDVTELSEEDKQLALEEYLDASATQQEITDRPAAEGDYVAVAYKESQDGQVVGDYTDEETEVLLGAEDVLFEKKLYGTSAGDKVTATESIENVDGDGTTAIVYDIEVLRVYSYDVPELTDAFAKETAGVETAKELEEQIYQEAMDSLNEVNREQMRSDLVTALVECSTVQGYPQSLYDQMYESVNLGYQFWGTSLEEMYGDDEEAIKEEVLLSAVNPELIMEAVAEAENLIVTSEELDSYKKSILEESGYESMEELEESFTDQELASMLLSEKVGLLLEENANITEITEEEYDNLMEDADESADEDEDIGEDDMSDDVIELTQSELEAFFAEDASGIELDEEGVSDAEETE